jgi:galactonate dehydratase
MKITRIDIYARPDACPPWILVALRTDTGGSGLGEATSFPGGDIIIAALREFEPLLVGRDPRDIEEHVQRLRRHCSYLGADGACCAAISGLEVAMWDLLGRHCGTPVCRLLGGRPGRRVPLYANGWIGQAAFTPEAFADRARAAVGRGFRALKFDPFSDPRCRVAAMDFDAARTLSPELEAAGFANIEAVRAAVGPGVRLAFDVHGRFNVPAAIRVGRRLEPLNPLFYEEPTEPDNFDAMRKVARALRVPICAGERYFGCKGFARYLEEGVLDIAMPDICRTGGILETRKIASLAETHGVLLAPHNPNGPVGTAASLHVMAACPNALILEYFDDLTELRARLGEGALQIRDGGATVPDAPGLGLTITDDALEQFAGATRLPGTADSVFGYSRERL